MVEALPRTGAMGVARTLAVVRKGRVPVRICNPYSYSLSIGQYQKLESLYHVDETDVHLLCDLCLSLKDDCELEFAWVAAATDQEIPKLPEEVSELMNRTDAEWRRVFAQHKEDFGRTDLVQHQIHTEDAPPVKERYQALPPLRYKEMKSFLTGMLEKGVKRAGFLKGRTWK